MECVIVKRPLNIASELTRIARRDLEHEKTRAMKEHVVGFFQNQSRMKMRGGRVDDRGSVPLEAGPDEQVRQEHGAPSRLRRT